MTITLERPIRKSEVVEDVALPNGRTRRVWRNLLDRVQRIREPDGSELRSRYDSKGRLIGVSHSSGEGVEFWSSNTEIGAATARTRTVLELGADGLPRRLRQEIDGRAFVVEYRRDEQGRVTALRYPGSATFTTIGELVTVTCGAERVRLHFPSGLESTEEYREDRLSAVDGAAGRTTIEFDERGRIIRAGNLSVDYDDQGRLMRYGALAYGYDEQGRLATAGDRSLTYGVTPLVERAGEVCFEYDALGRRSASRAPTGDTHYTYNLFGQIASVTCSDGRRIEYLYDGFGRLVSRTEGDATEYYVSGVDGERLATANPAGEIVSSYLWFGAQCIARIAGAAPGPIVESYHRLYGGRLAGIGDARGNVELLPVDDPYGGSDVRAGVPGFASLFGDPATGLWFAGSRWYDPSVAAFTTPDSWFGDHPGRVVPARLRRVLERIPGGLGAALTPLGAYAYCDYDPVNLVDRNGHSGAGVAWSFFSSLFWNLQLTSLAGQMELLNILIDTVLVVVLAFGPLEASSTVRNWYWRWSVYNLAPPVGSVRLGAFGLILNGLLKAQPERAWTLGNIIWERGSELREIEEKGARDLVICPNAAQYLGASSAVSMIWVKNPNAKATGTVPASGDRVDGAVWDPVGSAPSLLTGFMGEQVALSAAGASFVEVRRVTFVSGTTLTLDTPVDAAFHGPVSVHRLDSSCIDIAGEGFHVGRMVRFIRGTAVHLPGPGGGAGATTQTLPRELPSRGLTVTEYAPARIPDTKQAASFPLEFLVLRAAEGKNHDGYANGNFLRIQRGDEYFAREVVRKYRRRDLELDRALPTLTGAGRYSALKVVRLERAGSSTGGAAVDAPGGRLRARLSLGVLQPADPRPVKLGGVAVRNSGAAPTIERRIITELRLLLSMPALPNALHGVSVVLEHLTQASRRTTGTMDGASAQEILTAANGADGFEQGRAVRVSVTGGARGYGVIREVTGGNRIRLVEALPAADFGAGVAVEVRLFENTREYRPEAVLAPGDRVVLRESDTRNLTSGQVVRVRPEAGGDGVIRELGADSVLLLDLNEALPATHTANLDVEYFRPATTSELTDVSAPDVHRKLTYAAPVSYPAAAYLLIRSGREHTIAQIDTVNAARTEVVLREPVEGTFSSARTLLLEPTGTTTASAELDSARVLPPSHLDTELTRREALENHELQHTWQGAVWGPFLLSLPITWLVHIGFSFSDLSASDSAIARHASVGGLDSVFAGLFYLMAGSPGSTRAEGTVDAGLRSITLATGTNPDAAAKFSGRARITLKRGAERDALNYADSFDAAAARVGLRYPLDSDSFAAKFDVGDTVQLSVAPFENIRQIVNTVFSPHQAWIDLVPAAWGRALLSIMNRDAWFPFLGLYPLSLYRTGFDEDRLPNEQDAAFHSGDLYTSIVMATPHEIFVGQLTRVYAFLQSRVGGVRDQTEPANVLEVELPTVSGMTPAQVASKVHGTVLNSAGATARLRFRDHRFLPIKDRAANVVGTLFSSSQPGEYVIQCPGRLPPGTNVVFTGAFSVGFLERDRIRVRALGITPAPTGDFYETELVEFTIQGDTQATYAIRPRAGAANVGAAERGTRYRIPVLPAATASPHTDDIEIHCSYTPDKAVFDGPGQRARATLPASELTNFCEAHALRIRRLATPVIAPLAAGAHHEFTTEIAPVSASVTSALPAGATVNATLEIRTRGRPTTLRFTAPDHVSAPATIHCQLVFGADPALANRRTITFDVRVNPGT